MESQSGQSLPLIYREFDVARRGDWCDRGAMFDFLLGLRGEGKRLLDFGPGDGWPSLVVAPFAGEIVGVEGSRKRRLVCEENARRADEDNVRGSGRTGPLASSSGGTGGRDRGLSRR